MILKRTDRIDRDQAEGLLGGKPPGFDADPYKARNAVERGFGRLN